jgi:hypothetical protein
VADDTRELRHVGFAGVHRHNEAQVQKMTDYELPNLRIEINSNIRQFDNP